MRPWMRAWPLATRASPSTCPEMVVVPAAASTSPVTVPATMTRPPQATRSPSTRPSIRTVPPEATRSPWTVSVAGMVTSRPLRTFPLSSLCWAAAAGDSASATARITMVIAFMTIPFACGTC